MRTCGLFLLPILLAAQPAVNTRPFRIEELKTLPGWEVSLYARSVGAPRFMALGPNRVLYVADRASGRIVAIPRANTVVAVAAGLTDPTNLVWSGNDLYIGASDRVVRYRNAVTDDLIVRTQPERLISLPAGSGHVTRTVAIGPDGRIYVSAGSTCNFCVETDNRRAAITRYEADGTGATLFASGLRNSVGLAWHPVTGELWATDNGGDSLGDDIPPDEINIIRQGQDYGWPDCYSQRKPVDWGTGSRTARCPSTTPPQQELQAHSAPLGLSFYTGAMLPAQYTNDAFVAFHGSWNRNVPTGYKVVRVHEGRVEDVLWGFLDVATRTMSGRPVQAIPGPDGALYISDDQTGNIYRLSYSGPRIAPGGVVPRGDRYYEIYGTGFTGSVDVTANGSPVEMLFTGENQINVRIPEGLSGDVTLAVQNEKASDTAPAPPEQ